MEPNAYAMLKETIPTTSPEWKRADQAKREEQRLQAIEETRKLRLKRGFGLG